MKILQIITLSELGGAQSVVINLANKLNELGNTVIVAAGEGDGKMFSLLHENITCVQLKHLKHALSPLHDFLALFELHKLFRKFKPDIIHLHSSKAGMLGRISLPKHKIVYTVHGFDSIRITYRKFLPIERLMQYRCKAIVGVSIYDEQNLLAEKITHGVCHIYNGLFKPDLSQIKDFKEFQTTKKIILSIARVSPPKKHDLFIEVSRLLPEYEFIWIGNQTPIESGLSNCHFIGNIINAGAYCNKADIFMLPSNYEGMPMVILEAMSCGKPIIASHVGGISEIVKNGENGFTLENYPALFAEKIKYILDNASIYKAFCTNSLKIFTQKLTIDKMVNGYLTIYKQ